MYLSHKQILLKQQYKTLKLQLNKKYDEIIIIVVDGDTTITNTQKK